MLKDRIEKKNLIINSLIDLKEDDGKGKGRYFVSRFIEPGLAHYKELGDIVITKETLDKFIQSMVGCPVIIDHKDVTDKNVDKLRVGTISRVWYEEYDGWYYCEGVLTDDEAIDLVKNQGWNVSCSYSFVSDESQKTYHGKPIDMVFTDGEFLHLAIVEDPRYEGANIVVNKKDDDIEWITVKGNHIPIKKGQSKDEAVKEFLEEKQGQEEKTNKSILETIEERNQEAKKIKEKGELKDIQKPKSFIEKQREDLETGELVDITEDFYNRASKEELQKEFKEVQKEFAKWKEKKNTQEYKEYKNKLLKIKEIYEKRFGKKTNNSTDKENCIMQVLDELKNFILGVVNNEKEDEMKVKNEDKRKLIDEIGGILKDKVDDEIIRTVIKKAEELSYEPSEDDKADNKCKNEDDEDKKEDKKDEDEEDDKDVTKNEEDKKEEKEVKNSMKDLVMGGNGKAEEQKLYISRKERLEEGNKY